MLIGWRCICSQVRHCGKITPLGNVLYNYIFLEMDNATRGTPKYEKCWLISQNKFLSYDLAVTWQVGLNLKLSHQLWRVPSSASYLILPKHGPDGPVVSLVRNRVVVLRTQLKIGLNKRKRHTEKVLTVSWHRKNSFTLIAFRQKRFLFYFEALITNKIIVLNKLFEFLTRKLFFL